MALDRLGHWEKIYGGRKADEVSWHQDNPALSLELIRESRAPKNGSLIDVGGGASRLVDFLLETTSFRASVLDISPRALAHARERLGPRSRGVDWIEADITTFVPVEKYDVWHDRAAFHFLTEESDRRKYVDRVIQSLKPGGALILAAFASDGPEKCSGLPVRRYDAHLVMETFGREFALLREAAESHLTPWNAVQKFGYFLLKRVG
ncbi:MAG: class I SAM-dependent methyltransferase [Elusimicrobiota bacterium]